MIKYFVTNLCKPIKITLIFLLVYTSYIYASNISEMQMLANKGDPDAMFFLATHYDNNNELEKSLIWYEKAAEKNHLQAMFRLGYITWHGFNPVKRDANKAIYWFTKAAKLGHSFSQTWLGSWNEYYNTSDDSFEKAIYWYKKATEKNEVFSQYNLGNIEEYKKNYSNALKWYKKACENGLVDGCFLYNKLALVDAYKIINTNNSNLKQKIELINRGSMSSCYEIFVTFYSNSKIKTKGCQGQFNATGIPITNEFEYNMLGKLVKKTYYHPDEYGKDYIIVTKYDDEGSVISETIYNNYILYETDEKQLYAIPN